MLLFDKSLFDNNILESLDNPSEQNWVRLKELFSIASYLQTHIN